MHNVQEYYDRLAPFYHLIYGDWEQTLQTQGAQIQSLFNQYIGSGSKTVLDAACGIGSQAIALVKQGHVVTGSDLSEIPLQKTRAAAAKLGLGIDLVQGDMRDIYENTGRKEFDVVLAMDNSIAHLLSDEDLAKAFRAFFNATKPGGITLMSIRDYDAESRQGVKIKPYGVREEAGTKYVIFQVWEFDQQLYDLTMYCIVDDGKAEAKTHIMRSKLYAFSIDNLQKLLMEAGFSSVHRHNDRFFQPVLVAIKAA